MADPRTLLQRLHDPVRPKGTDAAVLAGSVRDNLERLFGTVQGSSVAEPEYGLPDLSTLVRGLRAELRRDLRQPDIEVYKGELRTAIERFEPRLKILDIQAEHDPADPWRLRFSLHAELLRERIPMGSFHASAEVDPTGRLRVSR